MNKVNIEDELKIVYKNCNQYHDKVYYMCCVHEAGHILSMILLQKIGIIKINETKAYVIPPLEIEQNLKSQGEDFYGGRTINNYNIIGGGNVTWRNMVQAIEFLGGILFANEFYYKFLGEYKFKTLEYMSERYGGGSDLTELKELGLSKLSLWIVRMFMNLLYKDKRVKSIHTKLIKTLLRSGHVDNRQIKNLCKENNRDS